MLKARHSMTVTNVPVPSPLPAAAAPTLPSPPMPVSVADIVAIFEGLTADGPAGPGALARIYAPEARFRDPFNDVTGLAAIQAIFEHMFRTLDAPHFIVHRTVGADAHVFLTWDMRFRFRSLQRGRDQVIHGATHLERGPDGRILVHRDYWDAAEELYEKLPVVGSLMRGLKSLGRT